MAEPEKACIKEELARDAALIGEPARHDLFATFAHPMVLLLGAMGFPLNGAGISLVLSAPAVLAAGTGLDTRHIREFVSAGGLSGVTCILVAGCLSDRYGDRFRDTWEQRRKRTF